MDLVVVYVENSECPPVAGNLDCCDVGAVDCEGSPAVERDFSVHKDH